MLKVSTRARYGIRALISIAIKQRDGKLATVSQISEQEEITEKYLEQVLAQLRAKKIIVGKRGVGGGYRLNIDEENVTLLDIFEILEGPIEPVLCVPNPETCDRVEFCPTRKIWQNISEAVKKELKSVTLKEVVDSCYVAYQQRFPKEEEK